MKSSKRDNVTPTNVVEPRIGYDRAASSYDDWAWQSFWERNEAPTIEDLLHSLDNARVLDAGTGTGRYFRLIQSLGHEVYGFDVSPKMLASAASKLGREANWDPFLRLGDVREIPFGDRVFNCVLCCRVLSHVEQLSQALTEILRVLRRGGLAFITDVDGRHRYDATRIPVDGENVWIRVHKHTLEEVVGEAENVGFTIVKQDLIRPSTLTWRPTAADFPSIDWDGDTPIAYRVVLERPR